MRYPYKKNIMKVKLLHEIGIHSVGAVIDIEDSNVIQLERNGMVERVTEQKESDIENKIEPTVKKKGNPNFGKKH